MSTTPSTIDMLIGQIENHLRFQKEVGQTSVELDADTLKSLRHKRSITTAPPVSAPSAPTPAAPAPPVPTSSSGDAAAQLTAIAQELETSDFCPLKQTALNTVPGQGNPNADIVFIGEAPGQDEDEQGLAFVGRSGQVLTRLINAMGLTRDDVWIGNIVKWRPPNNRTPTIEEIDGCMPYLIRQLDIIQPKAIVCLGGTAAKSLLDTTEGIMRMRGSWREFNGIPLMPTYHPSFLLRSQNQQQKQRYWEVWSDMEAVLTKLGMPIPKKKQS